MDGGQDLEGIQAQLSQMQAALPFVEGTEKEELEAVIAQLEELIKTVSQHPPVLLASSTATAGDNGVDDDHALFQAEIAALEKQAAEITQADLQEDGNADESAGGVTAGDALTHISEELAQLEGLKCQAPHSETWGQIGYYPAMISEIVRPEEDSDEENDSTSSKNIKLRVIFLHPVVKSQLLCPFFQEDRCRFADHECRYSHGEIVLLDQLRDYVEPDYTLVTPNARVLAKYHDELWYQATVLRFTSDGNCEVQFDKDNEPYEVGIHDTIPLGGDQDDESSDEDDVDTSYLNPDSEEQLQSTQCLLHICTTEALGDWERHTKGFGSKLMQKMGYVMGAGLGKNAEGRVIPVDAIMVPQGMSLDHFMQLKERTAVGSFSVEKKLKKAKRRHDIQELRNAISKAEKGSVFDFLNKQLFKNNKKRPQHAANVAKQCSTSLKKEMLNVGEDMKKVRKEIVKIKECIGRAKSRRDAETESLMKKKLIDLESKRDSLIKLEASIVKEQKTRSDKRKLTEF